MASKPENGQAGIKVKTPLPEPAHSPGENGDHPTLRLAVLAGELMLASGAEISRVEETINTILQAQGFREINSLVTPTGFYVSVANPVLDQPLTIIRRVRSRLLNFQRISAVNDVSRRLVRGQLTAEEARRELEDISSAPPPYSFWILAIAGAGTAASETLLLGGSALDCLPAFAATILVLLLSALLAKFHIPAIFSDFFGAALVTALALTLAWTGLPVHTSMVIAGGIILLVPGAALVSCVQDGIAGDLLSSGSRGLESLLKGAAIGSGVGLSLSIALPLGVPATIGQTGVENWQMPIQVIAAFIGSACYAVYNQVPRFAILTAGLGGGLCWLVYLNLFKLTGAIIPATFLAAFALGLISWGLARWQHSPVTLYILPGILPLLPGLIIYNGMLELARNNSLNGVLVLAQATFVGGALAAGVALSNSLAPSLWRRPQKPGFIPPR